MLRSKMSVAILAACAVMARGQVLYSTSFETSDGFAQGVVASDSVSQQGWTYVGPAGETAANVIASNPFTGSNALKVTATSSSDASWWYKNLNFNTSATSNQVVKVSWKQKVTSPTGVPNYTNSSLYGLITYDSAGNRLNGLVVDNGDQSLSYLDYTAQDWLPLPGITVTRDAYQSYAIYQNFSSKVVTFEVGGVRQATKSKLFSSSTVFGDGDFVIDYPAQDSCYFDDLTIEAYAPGTVRGTITLNNYTGDVSTKTVTMQVRNSSGAVIETVSGPLDGAGNFSLVPVSRGTYDLAFRSETHLYKKLTNVVLADEGTFGLSATLTNGDIDGNNIVNINDYATLSDNFNLTSASSGFNVRADLDGNGIVNINDYSILSDNFNLSGD